MTTPKIFTGDQIHDALLRFGFPKDAIWLTDDEYVLPTAESIQRNAEHYQDYLFSMGITYRRLAFDCDDFVLCEAAHMRIAHRKFYSGEQAVAVGFYLGATETSGHAVNFTLWPVNNILTVCTLEPQPTPKPMLQVSPLLSRFFVYC